MAGMEGVEPPLTEPESAVLPLDDIPVMRVTPQREKVLYGKIQTNASENLNFFELCEQIENAPSTTGQSCRRETRTPGSATRPLTIETSDSTEEAL